MAKIVSKGTTLKRAGVLVAQVISVSHSGQEVETYESSDLSTSGVGKEYARTGWVEGGSMDVEVFWDPSLAGHQLITDDILTPAESAWVLTFSDATTAAFDAAGISMDITVDMNDALKASLTFKLDQILSYPT